MVALSTHDVAEMPQASPVQRLAWSAGAALFLKVGGAGAALASQLILAQYLGARQFGEYVLVQSWLMIAVILVKGGWEGASARYVAEYSATQQYALLAGFKRMRCRVATLTSLAVALCAALALLLLQSRLETTLLISCWFMVLLVPLVAGGDLLSADLRARQQILWADGPVLLARPVLTLLMVLGLIRFAGMPAVSPTVLAAACLTSLAVLVVFLFPSKGRTAPAPQVAPQYDRALWWNTVLPMLGVALFQLLISQIDCIAIGLFRTTHEAGVYGVAVRMANVIPIGLIALNAVGAPLIAEQYALRRHHDLQRIATSMAGGSFLLTAPVILSMILLGPWILGAFGTEFQEAYLPLVILAGGQLINVLAGSAGHVLLMTGNQRVFARALTVSALGQVLLTLLLVPSLGMVGAALATTATRIGWNIALSAIAWRSMGIDTTLFSLRNVFYPRS